MLTSVHPLPPYHPPRPNPRPLMLLESMTITNQVKVDSHKKMQFMILSPSTYMYVKIPLVHVEIHVEGCSLVPVGSWVLVGARGCSWVWYSRGCLWVLVRYIARTAPTLYSAPCPRLTAHGPGPYLSQDKREPLEKHNNPYN